MGSHPEHDADHDTRTAPPDSGVYYGGRYWNDLPQVVATVNERISGDPSVDWIEHLRRTTGRVFERALSLNCGNGWVERELLHRGVVRETVGIDVADDLLEEARRAAAHEHLPARYEQLDVNSADFPRDDFDLVVDHAAAHHIVYLDRVFRRLCTLLPDDGVLAGFDYVGPHRNQYPYDQWREVDRVNAELPPHLRRDLDAAYPRLHEAIEGDPTEAVHSELIVATLEHYFEVEEFRPAGGAVAYPILTHNDAFFDGDAETAAPWVEFVLDADRDFLGRNPRSSLFAYFRARPRKQALADEETLVRRAEEEDRREAEAAARGGHYYPLEPFQQALEELRVTRLERDELARALDAVRSSTTWRLAGRLAQSPPGQLAQRLLARRRRG